MDQPNLLIFMTDQQRGDTVLPGTPARMPHTERFRKEGLAFSEAYCPSPHCCPSRATFFSGLYPSQHGVWNNVDVGNTLSHGLADDVRLWSEDLRDAGYRLFFSGKWHVSAEETPADRGFKTTRPMKASSPAQPGQRRPAPRAHEWGLYAKGMGREKPAERGEAQILRPGYGTYTHYGEKENPFGDGTVVDEAIDNLRQLKAADGPWCAYVGTLGPHDPYFVPSRFLDLYPLDRIQLPGSFHDRMDDKPALYRRTRGRFDQLTEREHREAIRHYLAFCSYQDHLFGEVLKTLDETGQTENTLVWYLSDHGDYMGDHGLWCKGLPCFRGAYHVPAIARWPKGIRQPGRSVEAYVSLADFAPTFLDASGVKTGRSFAGRSLMPFLHGEAPADWRDAIFTQSNGNELYGIQRSVTTRRWKYVYNGFDFDELHDLERDPHETKNLAGDPAHAAIVREMCQRMWRFAREHGDVCVNPYIMVSLAPYGPGVAFEEETRSE
jgi:arylsulfatase A-like enzyme